MAIDFKVETKRAISTGASVSSDGFSGGIRSTGAVNFNKGDKFTIQKDFVVYDQPLAGQFDDEGNPRVIQYTLVSVTDVKGNTEVRRFFPGFLNRMRFAVTKNSDGTYSRTNVRVVAEGTACDEYKKHATIQEGMEAISDKEIVVSKVLPVTTFAFGSTTDVREDQVPCFDFVKNPNKKSK